MKIGVCTATTMKALGWRWLLSVRGVGSISALLVVGCGTAPVPGISLGVKPIRDAGAIDADAGDARDAGLGDDAESADVDAEPGWRRKTTVPIADPDAGALANYGTYDLGPSDELLCVIDSVAGAMKGYSAGTDDAAASHTSVSLYIDADRHWKLSSNSPPGDPFSASASCVPWSALGLSKAPSMVRVDESAASEWVWYKSTIDGGPTGWIETPGSWQKSAPLPANSTCVVSRLGDDLGAASSVALVGSNLVVTSQGPDAGPTMNSCDPCNSSGIGSQTSASVICFSPPLPTTDIPLDGGPALPDGLCGLRAISGMASPTSQVDVSGPQALLVDAQATGRCFLYPHAPGDH